MLRKSLLDAVEQSGCTKVNIIAHSKGGLDARVLASMEDCAAHIASITTVATPHAGSRTLDWVMRAPTFLLKVAAVPVNGFYRWLGDSEPDFFTVCSQLTTNSMRRFNDEHPASSAIFCQSYATVMSSPLNDLSMAVPYLVVRHFEGQNDGLVAASAASYGSFGGIIVDGISRGVSHRDVVDRKQGTLERRVQQKNTGTQQASFDVVEWYLRLVADLRARGF
jgi:triacylglycerol lipase